MYTDYNFKTKKALKEKIAEGGDVYVFQPGLGSVPTGSAEVSVEGPHYPNRTPGMRVCASRMARS